jgi:hypothetical protein
MMLSLYLGTSVLDSIASQEPATVGPFAVGKQAQIQSDRESVRLIVGVSRVPLTQRRASSDDA